MKTLTIKTGLLILLTMLLVSCSKNDSLIPSSSKKMEGKWKFDKVKFQKGLSKTDVTSNYNNFVIEFKNDFTTIKSDSIAGVSLVGDWKVTTEWHTYTNMGQAVEVLNGYLIDSSTNQINTFNWENLGVTKKKMTAVEYKDGGIYTYTLTKL